MSPKGMFIRDVTSSTTDAQQAAPRIAARHQQFSFETKFLTLDAQVCSSRASAASHVNAPVILLCTCYIAMYLSVALPVMSCVNASLVLSCLNTLAMWLFFKGLSRLSWKQKPSKLFTTGPFWGESICGFSSQKACNVESVSMSWHYHAVFPVSVRWHLHTLDSRYITAQYNMLLHTAQQLRR